MSDTQMLPAPPTALLKVAHQRLRDLLDRYAALGPEDGRTQVEAFRRIREALEIHLDIEEALFYPAILENGDETAGKAVGRALDGHRRLKELLEDAEDRASRAEPLDVPMEELQRFFNQHLQRLEAEILIHARRLPVEVQTELSREMRRLQTRLEG